LGSDDRIRVPSPAAMISTVGPLTLRIVEAGARETAIAEAAWAAAFVAGVG
jgi:hypothetical protein